MIRLRFNPMIRIWFKQFSNGNDNFMIEDTVTGLKHTYTDTFEMWLIYDDSTTPTKLGYEFIGAL